MEAAPPPPSDASGPSLWRRLSRHKATTAALLAVAAVFVLCWRDPGTSTLRWPFAEGVYAKYGGYSWGHVRDQGEWWRFFSTLFVARWGLDAIIFLWLFYELGPAVERLLGSARFAALFLLTGAGGVAVGELVRPGTPVPGTMVTVYALLGAMPGLALGRTGSLRRAANDPSARSALFWLALWLGVGYFLDFGSWSLAAMIGGAALGAVLATGFAAWGRHLVLAVVFTALGLAASGGAVALAAQGMRWRDGKLMDRGRPAVSRLGDDAPELPQVARQGRDEASTRRAAQALRGEYEPRLDRFGPLPSGEGLSDADYVQVQEWLLELERVIEHPANGITGELDDLRVRCLLLLGRPQQAAALADEALALQGTARARALAGLAYFLLGGSSTEVAVDHLEGALVEDPTLDRAWPEVQYYLGLALLARRADGDAASALSRYLERVEGTAHPPFRAPLVARARAKLELLR